MTLSPKSSSPPCQGECYGTLGGSALRRGNLYRYADTVIASAWSFGDLPPVEFLASDEARIDIRLMNAPPREPAKADWIHHWPPQGGGLSLALSDKGEGFLLRFPGLADFSISINGRQVKAWPSPATDTKTLCHLLLDQVLPRVLAHQGRLVLHAGAVRVGEQALSVIGDTGSGKSTLTASLHGAGYPLLSDDGLVLTHEDDVTLALPVYTSLRLWPDAIAGIYAQRPAVAPVAHYSSKRRIVVRDIAAKNVPIPLASLYVLGLAAYDGRVSLRRLSPADACMAIIGNSFQLDVTDRCRAADVLAVASRIARHLPVFSLAYPRDFARLPEVHEAILRHHSE